ncbi:PREDICTED: ornithine decarboxylase-like, partial [Nelumbo nucifera]|uniref:ornithine decarboxylase n=1 Tax=Nelumbo nucifera TaxID=4432 RepID=A0A1U8Q126_NELNU
MGYLQIHATASNRRILQSMLTAPGIKGKHVSNIATDGLMDLIQSIVSNNQDMKDPFYVLDLGVVVSLMDKWRQCLPIAHPFYAVKCNPHPALLGALAALGANFDCASQEEIEAILALGVSAERIVYANPCKAESHIKYAAQVGVNLTTFDSLDEIEKIQRCHPKCSLLIRLKVPEDSGALRTLGAKYGALPEEVTPLLEAAHKARLDVVGVSFHVGSKVANPQIYNNAVAAAKEVFDTAVKFDMPRMSILDLGGGFTVGPKFE